MPFGKASWRNFNGGMWLKGPRENVPAGSLRRAFETYPARGHASILSRNGSAAVFPTVASDVLSLVRFNNLRYVATRTAGLFFGTTGALAAAPATWSSGGGTPTLNGGRVEFMEMLAQFLATNPNRAADLSGIVTSPNADFLFVSGAGAALKIDTANAGSYWGIDAPRVSVVNALTVTPGAQAFKEINGFNGLGTNAGASGFAVANDTTRVFDYILSDAASRRLFVPRDSELISTDSFAPVGYTPLDLNTFTTPLVASTDEDYIQFYVHVARPKHLKTLGLKFFVQSAGTFNAGAFNQDPNNPQLTTAPYGSYYHIDLEVEVVKQKRRRQLLALEDFISVDGEEEQKAADYIRSHPERASNLDALRFMHPTTVFLARNTWTKVTIPKGLFERAGSAGQANFTWANVVGMQVSVESNKQGACTVWLDSMLLIGGTGTRGDYQYTITYRNDNTGARSNPPYAKAADGTITMATTRPVELDRQGATIGAIPAALAAAQFRGGALGAGAVDDDQVTHIEIWRTIGNGRLGKPNSAFTTPTSIQMFLVDKIPIGTTSYVDVTSDFPGMNSSGGSPFLNPDQAIQFDNAPPWSVNQLIGSPRAATMGQAVYYPRLGRVFFLDNKADLRGRVFYSPPGRPESVVGFVDPAGPDDAIERLAVFNNELYAISHKFFFRLDGDDEPFTFTPIAGVAGTAYPYAVCVTDAGIFYIAQDGARMFNGSEARVVADDAIGPLFRGSSVEGLLPILNNSPFVPGPVASYGRDEVLLSDVLNAVYGYHLPTDSWRVIRWPGFSALYHEPSTATIANPQGVILAGTTNLAASAVIAFDGTLQGEQGGIVDEPTTDASTGFTPAPFECQTPSVFVAGEALGIIRILYIEVNTSAQTLTVEILLDDVTASLGTISSASKQRFEFNINRPANIAAVRIRSTIPLAERVEISSIELEVYESAGE